MADPLTHFAPPATCDDFLSEPEKRTRFRELWSGTLDSLTQGVASTNPNYYNPLRTAIGDAQRVKVEWTCFPKPVEDNPSLGRDEKFEQADIRTNQSEYSEWCVERDPATNKVKRVTFTTELVEYWEALWQIDPDRVFELYREMISERVQMADLRTTSGGYNPRNIWNTGGEIRPDRGGGIHMIVQSPANTLGAALGVVAGAASAADTPPTGGSFHADPLIAVSVTRAVQRLNSRISFSNPVGVYLQEPDFHRFELPAIARRDAQPQDYWRVTRGFRAKGCAMRAEFEVPAGQGFMVGDIKVDGRLIQWGSQIARALKSSTYVTPIPKP